MAQKRGFGWLELPVGICKNCSSYGEITDGHLPSGPAGPFCSACWDLLRADEADHLVQGRPIKGTVCADEDCSEPARIHIWVGDSPHVKLLLCRTHAAVAQAINDKAEAAR